MDRNLIISVVIILLLIIGAVIVFKRDRGLFNRLLATFVYSMMQDAEKWLGSKKGQQKLEMVFSIYEARLADLPFWSRLILRLVLPRKKLEKLIEGLIPKLNEICRPLYEANKLNINHFAKKIKDEVINEALVTKHCSDPNLINNGQLLNISTNFDSKVEKNGMLGAYAKLETDFRDETNFEAGLEAIYTF